MSENKLAEAKAVLKEYGISAKEGDSGEFEVTPGVYKQVSIEVTKEEETAYPLPTRPLYILQENPIPILPCIFGIEPWCWVIKYKDPIIDFDIHAVEVRDLDVYILRGLITGKIYTKFENKSVEGEIYEENVRTGEKRNERTVYGSADLDGDFDETIYLREIKEELAKIVKRYIRRTEPYASFSVKSNFEKRGYIEMIKSILRLLLTGSIYVDDIIKVTVEWLWRGERKSITRDIKIQAYLPVRDVRWHLW